MKTIITFPTLGQEASVPGVLTEGQVRTMFASQVAGINNLVATSVDSTDHDGAVRTFTFSPRTGNKG